MHKTGKRIGIAAFAMCLLVALAFGGMSAFAAVPWHGDQFGNSLTVEATNKPEMEADLAKTDVVVDVYRVAAGQKDGVYDAYNYTWEAPFGEGSVSPSWFDVSSQEQWDARAYDAAELLAKAGDVQSVNAPAGSTIDGLDAGIYLVLAHGADQAVTFDAEGKVQLVAQSDIYEYSFKPSLVAVPSKAADEEGVIRTDGAYGPWLTDVTMQLKPEHSPLYGRLLVEKKVVGAPDAVEPATFVFHLVGTTPDGKPYENYASVYYTGGASASTVVRHIPAGTELTVTEEYAGARYELASSQTAECTVVADKANAANPDTAMMSVSFSNTPTGGPSGHGIENNFTYESDGDWHWMAVPEQPAKNTNQGE